MCNTIFDSWLLSAPLECGHTGETDIPMHPTAFPLLSSAFFDGHSCFIFSFTLSPSSPKTPHETSPPAKRRRVITACVECYRRKQKCDRNHLRNICHARNLECTYMDPGEAQGLKSHQSAVLDEFKATSTKRKWEYEDSQTDEALKLKPSDDVSSQTGCSAQNDNSPLDLQRSFIMNHPSNSYSPLLE